MQTDSIAAPKTKRLVIDAPMRVFHWLFAFSFVGAYLSADSERWRLLHVTMGYTMVGLTIFRLLYGLVGPKPFRLSALWRKLSVAPSWIRSVMANPWPWNINWRQGQNLLMALLVASMVCMVLPLALSGYAVYNDWGPDFWIDVLSEIHEWIGELFLIVVLLHIGLIMVLSLLRKSDMAQPMFTGHAQGTGPDLVQSNRLVLATALFIAVLAFAVWYWIQSYWR